MGSKALKKFLEDNLTELKEKGLYNEIDVLSGSNGSTIHIGHRQLINLSSNNYLGLATNKRMMDAAKKAIDQYGVGAGAVRTINGTMDIHVELEELLAKFKGAEAAIALQSGFNCNAGAISAIMDKNDAILSDQLNHASIIDGCRLAGSKIIVYKHSDMEDLYNKAKEARESGKYNKIMVITDGVFSMDGDIAKLPEIVDIAQELDLITYVDDAHGEGVLGNGAGIVRHFGLEGRVDLEVGTLSKALGVVGGYIAGTKDLIDWLRVRARPFLFSTSLTPGACAAVVEAVRILMESTEYVDRLWENGNYLKAGLKKLGYNIGNSETPITPCIIGDEKKAQEFSRELVKEGVYVKSIVYPTVPLGTARVRNMPTADHTKEMLDQAIACFEKVGKRLNIIE